MKKILVQTQNISLYGLPWYEENEKRTHRLPNFVKDKVSMELWDVAQDTAGARIRFLSDSGTLGIIFTAENYNERKGEGQGTQHMYLMGLDLYVNGCFWKNVRPTCNGENELFFFRDIIREKRDIEIVLPVHLSVNHIRVVLDDDADVFPHLQFTHPPLVFYGTSITQGYSVSRPGQTFISGVSRQLARDVVNYGFSGAGRGEQAVAQVMAKTKASCYILDFGQNCESLHEFEQNLLPFAECLHKAAPDTPILLTTPIFYLQENWDDDLRKFQNGRRAIVKKAYETLCANGVKTHLLCWNEQVPFESGGAQTDGAHTNDLGAFWMCSAMCAALKKILQIT